MKINCRVFAICLTVKKGYLFIWLLGIEKTHFISSNTVSFHIQRDKESWLFWEGHSSATAKAFVKYLYWERTAHPSRSNAHLMLSDDNIESATIVLSWWLGARQRRDDKFNTDNINHGYLKCEEQTAMCSYYLTTVFLEQIKWT